MTTPTDASLRRAGLQWYESDGEDVPDECDATPHKNDADQWEIPALSRACVMVITGKGSDDKFTRADAATVRDFLVSNGVDEARAVNVIENVVLNLGLLGKKLGNFPTDTPASIINNPIDVISDTFQFLTKPETWLATGALVLGGGFFVFGLLRLMRS